MSMAIMGGTRRFGRRASWRESLRLGGVLGLAGLAGALGCAEAALIPVIPDLMESAAVPEVADYLFQDIAYGANGDEDGDEFGTAVVSGDFNCDGTPDVAIGVPGQDSGDNEDVGIVVTFFGEDDWFRMGPMVRQEPVTVSEPGDRFGDALAVGDFDDDGCDDLVIGSPYENWGSRIDTGVAHVRYGSPVENIALYYGSTITQGGNSGMEAGDEFGFALAVGDFDDDGYDDVAIGAPGEDYGTSDIDAGWVFIRMGSAGGLQLSGGSAIAFGEYPADSRSDYEEFGYALAAGDFDADGYDDLAIGAPMEGVYTGKVFIRPGAGDGLESTADYDYVEADVPEQMERFGAALATGSLQGDGAADLIVGVPWADDGKGRVDVFDNMEGELPNYVTESFDQSGPSLPETEDMFGSELTCGDFDRDGLDDIAIGVPNEGLTPIDGVGVALVRFGAPVAYNRPTRSEGYMWFDQRPIGAREAGDSFGYAMATIDIGDDGYDDLLIGAPFEDLGADWNTGVVFVTQPVPRYDTPFTGIFEDTNIDGAVLRASVVQGLDDVVTFSVWVESGHFEFSAENCHWHSSYDDHSAHYYADDPMVSAESYSLSYETDPTFGGGFTIPLNIDGGTGSATISFDAEGSDADGNGLWQTLEVDLTHVSWAVDLGWMDDTGSCPSFSPDQLVFERI
jgi:hypothetical protein